MLVQPMVAAIKPRLHQRNILRGNKLRGRATCCGQQVACCAQHVASNNMLRWCKRGLTDSMRFCLFCMLDVAHIPACGQQHLPRSPVGRCWYRGTARTLHVRRSSQNWSVVVRTHMISMKFFHCQQQQQLCDIEGSVYGRTRCAVVERRCASVFAIHCNQQHKQAALPPGAADTVFLRPCARTQLHRPL